MWSQCSGATREGEEEEESAHTHTHTHTLLMAQRLAVVASVQWCHQKKKKQEVKKRAGQEEYNDVMLSLSDSCCLTVSVCVCVVWRLEGRRER